MPVLVSAQDLATYLDQPVKREPAEQILDMVEAVVLTHYGADTPPEADRPRQLLRQVVLSAATRAYTNRTGLTSETIADYTYRRDSGGMLLSDAERKLISAARSGCFSGMVSVPLTTLAGEQPGIISGPWWQW